MKAKNPTGDDAPIEEVKREAAKILSAGKKADTPSEIIAEGEGQLILFKGREIRQVFHEGEWFFSIIDAIGAIADTDRPSKYWNDLKTKLVEKEDFFEISAKIGNLKMPTSDGKMRETEAVNVETLFRIVQSIPSKNAEPFKKWLAKVGYERIQEIQDPEIAVKRAILNWQIQGREDSWIEARLRTFVVRKDLTDEWDKRGIEGRDYGYLTNVVHQKTFGLKTDEHKALKGLKNHNLRDHMTDLELVFTMLGEKSTAAIAQALNAQGLGENVQAARSGGQLAGDARKVLETKMKKPVVSSSNFIESKRKSDPERLTEKKKE
jgi:hypothetical protein